MGRSFFMPENMNLKGFYAGKPALFQIFLLLLFMLAGGFISSVLGMGVLFLTHGVKADIYQYPGIMRTLQFLSSIGMFLFPAIAVAWTCSNKPSGYLSIKKTPNVRIMLLILISMYLFSPTITLTGVLNKQMELPSILAPIENWMRTQEDAAEHMTELLLSEGGILTLLSNLIVIAVTAAITEEFLFRGTIQRIIGKWSPNHHIIIWSAAFIFSAFHMQFFGFIPRLLLGAYFGYLLYWSKCIWIPVFAHFVNNATAVIGMSNSRWKNLELVSGDISDAHLLSFASMAFVTLISFIILNKYIRKELIKDN